MANIYIRAHAWMIALVHEPAHRVHVIEQAQAKWFQFKRDSHILLVRVITEPTAAFQSPLPLRLGWNHFALPDILAEHEQDILRAPRVRQINELLRAFDGELAHGLLEINDARSCK